MARTEPTNGAALKAIRQGRGLTVREVTRNLANRGIEVHEDHLHNIERGARNANPALITALADVLDVPPASLKTTGAAA